VFLPVHQPGLLAPGLLLLPLLVALLVPLHRLLHAPWPAPPGVPLPRPNGRLHNLPMNTQPRTGHMRHIIEYTSSSPIATPCNYDRHSYQSVHESGCMVLRTQHIQ